MQLHVSFSFYLPTALEISHPSAYFLYRAEKSIRVSTIHQSIIKYHIHQHIFIQSRREYQKISSPQHQYHYSSVQLLDSQDLLQWCPFLEFKQLIIKIFYILKSDPCSIWGKKNQIWKGLRHNEFYFQQIKQKN